MAVQMLGIKTKFTDDQGRPLVGGKVHAYFAGTTTYQDTFKDPDMTIVNTNPIILDDSGSADVYLNGSYRIRIFDKNDVLIEEQDGVTQSANGEITTAKGEIIGLYGAVLNSLTNEVKRAVAAEKTIADSLTSETTRAKSAESALQSSISDETTRAKKAESDLNTGLAKEVSDRKSDVTRLDEADAVLQAQINSVGGGKLAYKAYAEMIADKSNIAAKSSIDIIADTDDKNGTYLYDGTDFVKSQYDIEKIIRAKVQNTFGTYAQMVASNLSDGAYALVADDIDANNGIYIKNSGVWEKSKYSVENTVKGFLSKNLFLGFDKISFYTGGLNATTYHYSADIVQTKAEKVYVDNNLTGALNLIVSNKLLNSLNIWVKVKSTTLNGGDPIRFLLQTFTADNSKTFISRYVDVPEGTTGWFNLLAVPSLSQDARENMHRVFLGVDSKNGSELIVEDFYVGSGSPLENDAREDEPDYIKQARNNIHRSILPDWKNMPTPAGVTLNVDGDITVAPNTTYTLDIPCESSAAIYYSTILEQESSRDCRLNWSIYSSTGSLLRNIPFFPLVVGGMEYYGGHSYNDICRVKVEIRNSSSTNPITLRQFDICYNRVVPTKDTSKLGIRFNEDNFKEVILPQAINAKEEPNLALFANFEDLPFNLEGKRRVYDTYNKSISVTEGRLKAGEPLTILLEDMEVVLNEGSVILTTYFLNEEGTIFAGSTSTVNQGTTKVTRTVPTTAKSFVYRFDIKDGAELFTGHITVVNDYSTTTRYIDTFHEDKTGVIKSSWQYEGVQGYKVYGRPVEYTTSVDDGYPVLNIPVTDATGYGQGAMWIIDVPENAQESIFVSFQLKKEAKDEGVPKLWTRFFRKNATKEYTAKLRNLGTNEDGSWTTLMTSLDVEGFSNEGGHVEFYIYNGAGAVNPLSIKRFIATQGPHNPLVENIVLEQNKTSSGLLEFDRVTDALAAQPNNVFNVGRQMFKPRVHPQTSLSDYELLGGRQDLPNRLNKLRYVDSNGFRIEHITPDDNVYLRKGSSLYKTTVEDLVARCPLGSLSNGEMRSAFNSEGLNAVSNNLPSNYVRELGNGDLVCLGATTAFYSTDGGVTWQNATGYQDVKGEFFNGWGVSTYDNIVLTSGYKAAAPTRGTGRVNYSSDFGKTYKILLDLETSPFIDDAKRSSMHIHSVKYDKWWKGVWVVMGDGAFNNPNSELTSNIWFITNPEAEPEDIKMISYNTRGADWLNEQHTSVHLLQDCVLFGSDANPTGLYRMARTLDPNTLRDRIEYINGGLSHYGCTDYQHKASLPMTIYFGIDGSIAGTHDIVYLTYDGVNITRIYEEPDSSNASGLKVSNFAYALDSHFVFERRGDNRYTSNNTWVVADIKYDY